MPYLKIQTSARPDPQSEKETLATLSAEVAAMLGKPERFVMVAMEGGVPMVFAGTDEPAAYLELKSLGLPQEKTAEYSARLCALIETHLAIPKGRIYIEFASPERHMFGWDGRTF